MPDQGDTERDGARERERESELERDAARERRHEEWRESARKRRRRHRILWGAAASVAVLGVAFLALRPTATDWWAARTVCDGGLPDGALDELRSTTREPDARLKTPEEELDSQLGRWTCHLGNKGDERVIDVQAYTRSDDIDGQLAFDFQEHGSRATEGLPGGLPGYVSADGLGTVLLRECPGLDRDPSGQPRRLYTSVLVGSDARPADMLRASVGAANKAAGKLGCGGEDLRVPDKGDTEPESVPPEKTRGTPCAAFAGTPLRAPEWTVDVQASSRKGPVGSCTLRPKGHDDEGEPYGPLLELTAWYGDWSQRSMYEEAPRLGESATGSAAQGVRPWMTEHKGWAMARCGGQAANFSVSVRDEDRMPDRGVGPKALDQLRAMKGEQLRSVLAGFARQQSELRGCEGLRLPAEVLKESELERR